jgi:hypothetical protein
MLEQLDSNFAYCAHPGTVGMILELSPTVEYRPQPGSSKYNRRRLRLGYIYFAQILSPQSLRLTDTSIVSLNAPSLNASARHLNQHLEIVTNLTLQLRCTAHTDPDSLSITLLDRASALLGAFNPANHRVPINRSIRHAL